MPSVLVAEVRAKPRVVACNAAAARRGVEIGMALAQARALAGDLEHHPWDDERLARAALDVTAALLAASPRVGWAGARADRPHEAGVWWVDAAGLGDEAKLARRLLAIARAVNAGPAQVGIGDSAIVAYAATFPRFAKFPARRMLVVPPGRGAKFLAPYPLGLLELDEDLDDALHALGLTTVGRFAALAPDEVEARFGAPGLAVHRLARGLDTRGPVTPRDDALPVVSADLGGPVATSEPLLFVLKGGLATLGEALRAKGLAARELTVTLTLDDGGTAERAVRPARPSTHEVALFDHVRAAFEDWPLPEPVVAVALRASVTVPASGEQGDLLVPRWADPAALEAAFDRIRAREGGDAVAVPERRDGHLPADAGAWATDTNGVGAWERGSEEAKTGERRAKKRRHHADRVPVRLRARPPALRLLAVPAPARVRLGRAGLIAYRHADAWHDVAAWAGPERLAPRWWTTDDAAARDYYTVRGADGTLCLLFRAGTAWFVEGWWD